jgi:hypothetical protein
MLKRTPQNRLVSRKARTETTVEVAFTWQRKLALAGAIACAGLVGLFVVYRGAPAPVTCVLEQVAPLWVGYEEVRGGWALNRFDYLKCRGLTASLLEVADERKTLVREVVQQIQSHRGDLAEFQQGGFLGVAEKVVPAFGKEPGFVPDKQRVSTASSTTAPRVGSAEETFPQEELEGGAEAGTSMEGSVSSKNSSNPAIAPEEGVSKESNTSAVAGAKELASKLADKLPGAKGPEGLVVESPSLKALEDASKQLPAAMTAPLGLRVRAAGTLVYSLVLRREALLACAKDKAEVISQYRDNLELPFAVATLGQLGLPVTQAEAMLLADGFLALSEDYTATTGTLQVSCKQAETYLAELNLFVEGNHPLLPGCRVLEDEEGLRLKCD